MDEEMKKLLADTDILAKETFQSSEKLVSFLVTLSKMYNISYNNILLLKKQREDVSFVANKETMEKYKLHIRENEKPLKIIKRIKINGEEAKFTIAEVFDISQTDAIKKQKPIVSAEYIQKMLKGMCARRGIIYEPNELAENIERIVIDIKQNSRVVNNSICGLEQYASQTQAEVDAVIYAVGKRMNILIENDKINDICKWSVDKDSKTIKESLKYIQKFTNYFIKDFEIQEKLYNFEREKQETEELE